jgi:hypothetical protein
MNDRELMQQALDALITAELDGNCEYGVTDALRTRLAQPEQEPVAQVNYNERQNIAWLFGKQLPDGTLLYTAPPQREWKGLTDEERQECLYSDPIFGMAASTFARAIEAKLKEKNA